MCTEIQCRLEEAQVEMTGVGRKDEGKKSLGWLHVFLRNKGTLSVPINREYQYCPSPRVWPKQPSLSLGGGALITPGFPGAARYQVAWLWVSGEAGVAGNGIVDTTDPVALRGLDASEQQRATLTIQRQMEKKSGGVQMWVSGGSASPPTPKGQWQCGEGQKMANIFCQN